MLDYGYFKNYYKTIAIDLIKQKALGADPKAMQQINFIGNLNRSAGALMFFIIDKEKETILGFGKELQKYSNFIFCSNIKILNITL